jgi:hypothetical protein
VSSSQVLCLKLWSLVPAVHTAVVSDSWWAKFHLPDWAACVEWLNHICLLLRAVAHSFEVNECYLTNIYASRYYVTYFTGWLLHVKIMVIKSAYKYVPLGLSIKKLQPWENINPCRNILENTSSETVLIVSRGNLRGPFYAELCVHGYST